MSLPAQMTNTRFGKDFGFTPTTHEDDVKNTARNYYTYAIYSLPQEQNPYALNSPPTQQADQFQRYDLPQSTETENTPKEATMFQRTKNNIKAIGQTWVDAARHIPIFAHELWAGRPASI